MGGLPLAAFALIIAYEQPVCDRRRIPAHFIHERAAERPRNAVIDTVVRGDRQCTGLLRVDYFPGSFQLGELNGRVGSKGIDPFVQRIGDCQRVAGTKTRWNGDPDHAVLVAFDQPREVMRFSVVGDIEHVFLIDLSTGT